MSKDQVVGLGMERGVFMLIKNVDVFMKVMYYIEDDIIRFKFQKFYFGNYGE